MVKRGHLNDSAKVLVEELLAAFPSWDQFLSDYGPADDTDAEPGSVQLAVPIPVYQDHTLRILLRGNSVEIAYDDARPPGPAEKLFIFEPPELRPAARAIADFLQQLLAEEIVVVREPLGFLGRLLRRDCTDLAWFRGAQELAATSARRYTKVYSWRGTKSWPPVAGAA